MPPVKILPGRYAMAARYRSQQLGLGVSRDIFYLDKSFPTIKYLTKIVAVIVSARENR
jgi:hypothetical protein